MKRLEKVLERLWVWSIVVTLPVTCVFIYWASSTYSRWSDFGLRHPTQDALTLRRVGAMEAQHLPRVAQASLNRLSLEDDIRASGMRMMQLFVPQQELSSLFAQLPKTGFEYKDGQLAYDGALRPVEVRLRGDSVYHWGYWKKSWRIKTKRDVLFEGMRRFNLIAPRTPELVNNHLSHLLASRMGLVAPRSELVLASINGDFEGVFILTEQLEESTLREAGLMPGDLYSGDNAAGSTYTGILPELFETPGSWSKRAINNHYPEASLAPLEELLRVVNDPLSAAAQKRLGELIDIEAFARFSAFESLACTVHSDKNHNWRLYYDPWKTRFVPVIWDPMGWIKNWRAKRNGDVRADVIASPLHVALFQNADFLRARERAFADFFTSGKAGAFMADARREMARLERVIEHDPHIVVRARCYDPGEVRRAMSELDDYIVRHFNRLREIHLGGGDSGVKASVAEGSTHVALEVTGRRQIDLLQLVMDDFLTAPVRATVSWRARGRTVTVDVSGATQQGGESVWIDADLVARHVSIVNGLDASAGPSNHLDVRPGYYEVRLEGVPSTATVREVRYGFVGESMRSASMVESIEPHDMGAMAEVVKESPWRLAETWSGVVELEGDVTVGDLVIDAGCTIRCAPGSTLLIEGRLLAHGSADRPIRFVPMSAEQEPWGGVALKGRAANGSRLEHCVFKAGSGWKQPLAEYSAMFSIHEVDDVDVSHCRFEDSQIVDDMVHGVYSTVRFIDCVFVNSLSDALDMDISQVQVLGCRFEGSGNDALDLMSTSAVISDCTLVGSGDKGVSVGERSRLLLLQSLVDDCEIGVQVKDDSRAIIANVDFVNNRLALDAYKKNWRYNAGGLALAVSSRFEGAGAGIHADKHSTIALTRCTLQADFTIEDGRRVYFARDVKSDQPAPRVEQIEPINPTEIAREWELDGPFYGQFWSQIKLGGRGRTP